MRETRITVTGIRDYGDEGVAEYVLMNLIRRLHGVDGYQPLLGGDLRGIRSKGWTSGAGSQRAGSGQSA